MSASQTLDRLCRREDLGHEESRELFATVLRGELGEALLAALLTALKMKGESADEIAGAAQAMREASLVLDTGAVLTADSCGTGGDGAATVNVSTAAALVCAEAGVPMAKHGNRSISSRCGSADVLEACGIAVEAPAAESRRALDELSICFLFAPQYHPGVRHAMPVRRQLGVRTLFNLLGPLANPARPAYQLLGVYDPARCELLAQTLGKLGCRRALVVHGAGLDEIALHGPTRAALLEDGEVRSLVITPEDAGLSQRAPGELAGGDPDDNARWLEAVLAGAATAAQREAVAINAGALLWIAGAAPDHRRGTEAALAIITSGKAAERLARWRALSAGGRSGGGGGQSGA
jgi:anthranilate phosphoribosyltransferase